MVQSLVKKVNNFFANGHERTLLAKKNIAISFGLKGLTIITGLLLVPLTINYINPTQYGIWLTLSSVVGWFYFLDIGLANGLKNKLAEANAIGDDSKIKAYISTTYAMLLFIAITIFALFFICNYFWNWNKILNVHGVSTGNLNTIALIIFGSFCMQFVLQVISSILTAFHAIAKVSLIYTIGQFGCLISIYALTRLTNGSLLYLVISLTCVPLLVQFGATIYYFKKLYPRFMPSYKVVDIKYAKILLGVGGVFFFVQIGSLLLFQTDNIVITQLFGPQKVTVFNIAYKLFSVITMVFTIVMNPFWTAFTDAYAKKDFTWIENIFSKLYKYFLILSVIAIILLIFSPFLFKIWLGNSVKVPFMLSAVMVVYIMGICWMTIHCFFVNGIGKIKLQLYLYIISTLINIPIAIFLGKWLGIIGVTLSNILVLLMMGIVLYIQCKKILNNTARGVWNA